MSIDRVRCEGPLVFLPAPAAPGTCNHGIGACGCLDLNAMGCIDASSCCQVDSDYQETVSLSAP
ncbi:MAG TPA: hypothetical protein VK459_10700 [Polyangiaceae bacterium]|nr:hypothetical protein [Polyangiaceae bacterium]